MGKNTYAEQPGPLGARVLPWLQHPRLIMMNINP